MNSTAVAPPFRPFWRIPPPGEPVVGWQISPLVDVLAYHFSWLWVLIPLALFGPKHPGDYQMLFAVVLVLTILHRHFTMPYIYLDSEVFHRHITRFTVIPALLFIGFLASPFLGRFVAPVGFLGPADAAAALCAAGVFAQIVQQDRRGFVFPRWLLLVSILPFAAALLFGFAGFYSSHHSIAVAVVVGLLMSTCAALALSCPSEKRAVTAAVVAGLGALAFAGVIVAGDAVGDVARWPEKPTKMKFFFVGAVFVAALWNLWHTTMQKFGILRVYAAKQTELPPEKRTPAWVDRFLIWGFIPLFFFTVGPSQRDAIYKASKALRPFSMPLVDAVTFLQPYFLVPTALLAAASVALFFYYEYKTNRLRSMPRISMGIGMTLLHVAILIFPLKGYIAYGFSHGIEYMVFVWAYQRRRYAHPLAHRPLLQRFLSKPWLAYGAYVVLVGGFFVAVDHGKAMGLPTLDYRPFDIKLAQWGFAWAVWHSMVHFYFDGFLWKMRLPTVRASL